MTPDEVHAYIALREFEDRRRRRARRRRIARTAGLAILSCTPLWPLTVDAWIDR